MDIWLVYLVKILLLPLSSLLLLAFLGYISLVIRNGKGGWILVSALFCLSLLSLPFVAVLLGKTQEKYQALDLSISDMSAQAIVVIGGGIHSFAPEYSSHSTVNSQTLTRLRYTALIARETKLPVLVSGGNVFDKKNESEAVLMARVLNKEFNIPVKWMEKRSRNTAENAIHVNKVLDSVHIKRIILVTHAMHMARAVEQFENSGFTVFPAPTAFLSGPKFILFNFLPSAHALEISSYAIHEWLGRWWYRLRYIQG